MPTRKKLPHKPKRTPGTYWHGGAPGLQVGEMIVPAQELGRLPDVYALELYEPADPSRVYITDMPAIAESFASQNIDWSSNPPRRAPGTLYRVDPVGELLPDPDYADCPNICSCERARIVEVAKTGISQVDQATHMAVLRWHTWDDGAPLYDVNGYPLPPAAARRLGITSRDLVDLGFGASVAAINQRCAEIFTARGIDLTPFMRP